MRFSKVRITDNRPRAGGKSPLEAARLTRGGSVGGLDYLTAIQKREAAEHDRNIAGYTAEMVAAAFADLYPRRGTDRKDPEQRWIMERKAALGRLAVSMRERGLT
jgi:hypothetical protein